MALILSRYLVVTDATIDAGGKDRRVLFSTRTGEARTVSAECWDTAMRDGLDTVPAQVLEDLSNTRMLVDEEEDELAAVLSENREAVMGTDDLQFVVHPSSNCQFGCDYCGQTHTPQKLSAENRERFVRRARSKLAERPFKSMGICWFGGEPLLALDVIRDLTAKLKALAKEHGCVYKARIVTNGQLLTPKTAQELYEICAVGEAEITLDGPAEHHDRRRHLRSGGPTFQTILDNLTAVARLDGLDMRLTVRCNVDRRNCGGVVPLLEQLAERGLQDRIQFYTARIHSWGNDADQLAGTLDEHASWEIEWLAHMRRLGFAPNLIPTRRKVTCVAVDSAAEVVDAAGVLSNCTEVSYVASYEPQGSVNAYAIGSLEHGEMPSNPDKLASFNDRIERDEVACHACTILPICGGACPKHWLEGRVPCPPIKANITQRLLLRHYLTALGPHPAAVLLE